MKLVFALGCALALGVLGCPHHTEGPGGSSTAVVVGVLSEDLTMVGTLRFTTTIDGAPATDETLDVTKNPKWYPKEIKLEPKNGGTGGVVEVKIQGFVEAGLRDTSS